MGIVNFIKKATRNLADEGKRVIQSIEKAADRVEVFVEEHQDTVKEVVQDFVDEGERVVKSIVKAGQHVESTVRQAIQDFKNTNTQDNCDSIQAETDSPESNDDNQKPSYEELEAFLYILIGERNNRNKQSDLTSSEPSTIEITQPAQAHQEISDLVISTNDQNVSGDNNSTDVHA